MFKPAIDFAAQFLFISPPKSLFLPGSAEYLRHGGPCEGLSTAFPGTDGGYGNTTFFVSGFHDDKRESHFAKHGEMMGFKNVKEYEQAGIRFMGGSLSESAEEIVMTNGERCRVDHSLGLFGVVNHDGSLRTFYDPSQYKITTVDEIEKCIRKDEENGR